MNVPGGMPEAPVRTWKLAVLGDEVRKYDKALQRLERKLQLAILFLSTPQRVDAIRYAMDAVCHRRNARMPNILREARKIVGDRNLARLRDALAPSLRNIAPGRPWKVEAHASLTAPLLLCPRNHIASNFLGHRKPTSTSI